MSARERQPLLQPATGPAHRPRDAADPVSWPAPFKWAIVVLLASMGFVVTFTCTSVIPLAKHIVRDLGHDASGTSSSVLLVTIWELGEAAGPLFLAPLSEAFGRYPVINVANLLFIAATVLAALSPTTSVLIVARALTGLAVTSNVLNPAIVGDMLVPEQRGAAMTLVVVTPIMGGAVGPVVGGLVAEHLGWRMVLWISAVFAAALEVVFLICLRETCVVVLERRKGPPNNLGSESLPSAQLLADDRGSVNSFWESSLRPFIIFAGSGVLRLLCVFSGVAFALVYVVSVTLPGIVQGIYQQSLAVAGFALLSFTVGATIGVVICNRSLDRVYTRLCHAHKGVGRPEFRLPLATVGGVILPVAVVMYGAIAQLRLPLLLILLSVVLLGVAVMLTLLPILAYVTDAFGGYSASALTGLIFTRSLLATFLPLVVGPLTERFRYGGCFAMLGAFCLCLAPVPFLVMRLGPRWRQFSKYTACR